MVLDLAGWTESRNIFLIGCDNSALLGNHHAHDQNTRWKGVLPQERYDQYYEGLAEVRSVLRSRGVQVVSLSPFLGLGKVERDFRRLCTDMGQETYVGSRDVSPAESRSRRMRLTLRRAWHRALRRLTR